MKSYYLVEDHHIQKALLINNKNNQAIQKLHCWIIIIKKNLKKWVNDQKIWKIKIRKKKKNKKYKFQENNKQVILIKKKQEVYIINFYIFYR